MTDTAKPAAPHIRMDTDHGVIELDLWPDVAPKTVENFVTLANKGYYNGLTFHRIIPGFMVQRRKPGP